MTYSEIHIYKSEYNNCTSMSHDERYVHHPTFLNLTSAAIIELEPTIRTMNP